MKIGEEQPGVGKNKRQFPNPEKGNPPPNRINARLDGSQVTSESDLETTN